MRRFSLLTLLALLAAPAAGAAGLEPYLVKDIEPVARPGSSDPSFPVTFGGAVLFFADDGLSGRQLWRSDGTAAGTWQLSEAAQGELPNPHPFLATERLYFFLSHHPLGSVASLWVSDGTPAGTFRLTHPGQWVVPWQQPFWVASQGVLYFVGWDAEHGSELWRSDGTPAGTYLVADVRPGPEGSNARGITEHKGRVWFGADDGLRGGALWSTDGTAAGTVLAIDPVPSSAAHGVPEFITAVGNRLTFFAPPPGAGRSRQLWAGDGTPGGTAPVTALSGGKGRSSLYDAVVRGNRLYFIAEDRKGQELWVSDGTARGTRALTSFAKRDAFFSAASPDFLELPREQGLNGRFIFLANDGIHGPQPWVTDGTPRGTRLLRDRCPGPCPGEPVLGPVLAGRLYFTADELWSTDGTPAGTRLVRDICPEDCSSSPYPIFVVDNRLLFAASDRENGRELWSSDGTAAGTVRVSDFEEEYLWPDGFSGAVLDGRLLFDGSDGEHGTELWVADGTPGGTGLVADVNRSDVGGSFPRSLLPLGSQVVFAIPAAGGSELWKSDGTAAGTVRLRTFGADELDGASPEGAFAEAGGQLFYFSHSAPWRTDGTAAGTFRLTGGNVPGCCVPREMRAVGSTVFFELQDHVFGLGTELWASDGTVAGTRLVLDIMSGAASSDPRDLTAFQGKLFFSADAPGIGRELWTSDGTAAGTVAVADLNPGAGGSVPRLLTVHGGRLWFFAESFADGGEHGLALWSSDGTGAGTRLEAAELVPRPYEAQHMVSLGDRLVFTFWGQGLWVTDVTGTRKIHDRELDYYNAPLVWTVFEGRLYYIVNGILWSTDGTEAGTGPLLDRDGNPIFTPYRFAVLGDRLVFTAQNVFGLTLWESDGTPAGTFPIEPPVRINSPVELVGAGERVFFPSYDSSTGWELWAVREEVP